MSPGYKDIKILVRNLGEFQEFTKTTGELSKMKYIKYLRMKNKVYLAYMEKIKYVKVQDFEKASDARDKEVSLAKQILREYNEITNK